MRVRIYKTAEECRLARQTQINERNRTKMIGFSFRLNAFDDADVIAWIQSQPNKVDSIRSLIRSQLAK